MTEDYSSSSPSHRQDDLSGPSAVVSAAFAAQDRGDVRTLVGLIDPDAMSDFKDHQVAHDAVFAELATLEDPPRDPHSMLRSVFRVRDVAEFERLSPEEVVTRWFELTTKQQALVNLEHPSFGARSREILGQIADGDNTVHVVFRQFPPVEEEPVPGFGTGPRIRVITVRLTPVGWRVQLNGGLILEESGGWAIGYDGEDGESLSHGSAGSS